MAYETTEITDKIQEHREGKITDEELVKYLTEQVKYKPGAVNPHAPGTGEWWNWSTDGPPYTPGSFDEVNRARDRGLLDPKVYKQVMRVFFGRQKSN